jgi:hypothetical protein
VLFNLPDYHVIDAVDLPGGGRRVVIEATSPPGCPGLQGGRHEGPPAHLAAPA